MSSDVSNKLNLKILHQKTAEFFQLFSFLKKFEIFSLQMENIVL